MGDVYDRDAAGLVTRLVTHEGLQYTPELAPAIAAALRAAADEARTTGHREGLNAAAARLAMWEMASVGEEITFAEHAIKIVTALLPSPDHNSHLAEMLKQKDPQP